MSPSVQQRLHRALFTIAACALLGPALTDCRYMNWHDEVIDIAAFEHHCPRAEVTVLADNGLHGRSVQLDVCGEERLYRHTGASGWVDFTTAVASPHPEGDDAHAESDEAAPWRDADLRTLLHSVNDGVLACTDDVALAFHVTLGTDGRVRELRDLPSEPSQAACIREVMSAVDLPGEAGEITILARFGEPHSGGDTGSTDLTRQVRARIDERAARALACVGGGATAIVAAWDESGVVRFSLNEHTDPSIAECVTAALGEMAVPTGSTAGRVLHAIGP